MIYKALSWKCSQVLTCPPKQLRVESEKAHYTHKISHWAQLHLKGIKVIYNDFSEIKYIYPIIVKDKI